jgi:predicted class III extradiol MEMO1 family dioxygenase
MFAKRSEVRHPAVAGAFYPREAQELRALSRHCSHKRIAGERLFASRPLE